MYVNFVCRTVFFFLLDCCMGHVDGTYKKPSGMNVEDLGYCLSMVYSTLLERYLEIATL